MTGTYNAGSIVYEVDMETAKLIAARREVDAALNGMGASMGRLEVSLNRTERSISSMEGAVSQLTGVAKGLAAALTIHQVAEWGNAWVTVNNKLANSVRANEQLIDVTQRVFDISQNTMSSLDATATLYGRLERATRSAGTSTKDLITLTSTINKGLAVSGATTEEASSTMTQLSQALASGVLRGEEFNSLSENGSRLAVALANSLGVTIGQLRAMAAQGQLTTDVVVKGLLQQSDVIGKEFANTAVTMGQAFTIATNNITKFVGESSTISSSIHVFNDGIISLSQNLDAISGIIATAATIFGGRFAGALAMATKARIEDALAARAQTVANAETAISAANAARVTAVKTGLDKQMALSNVALAQTEYNVAKGSAAEAFALENLIAVKSVAIQVSATHAEAELAEAAAMRTAAAAAASANVSIGSLARNALSLIGGPTGLAVIAAAGIFYFYQKMQQAKQESIDFADKLDGVISKMKEMSQVQLAAEIDKASKSITAQAEEVKKNQASLDNLNGRLENARLAVANLRKDNFLYGDAVEKVNSLQSESIQLTAKLEKQNTTLSQTISKTGILRAQMNGQFAQGIDLLKRDGQEAGVVSGLMNQLGNAIDFAGRAKEKFNSTNLLVERPTKVQDYLDKQQQQVDLQGELNDRKREQLKAEQDIRNLGGSEQDVMLARQRAGAEYDSLQAQKAQKKEARDSASAQKKATSQAERNARVLDEYSQKASLSADSTSDLSREQAILAARQKLTNPTPQQVAQIEADAAAIWDKAAAIKAQATALKLVPEDAENNRYQKEVSELKLALDKKTVTQQQHNAASEQLEKEHQVNLAKIRSQQVVSPTQEAVAQVDPVQQLANENAQKLALIQQFEQQRLVSEQQGLALRNAANTEYEQQRITAQWAIFKAQSDSNAMLATTIESLSGGATNAITGLLNGTQSLSEAFANLGTAVINGVVSSLVQMGTQWVMSAVMGQAAQDAATAANQATATAALAASTLAGTAAAGTLLASWSPAAMAASIATSGGAATAGLAGYTTAMAGAKAMSIAGAREHGGPVSASNMYKVGEGGKPEIFKASNGSQYMIPGDNGSVISNKDIGGSGGSAYHYSPTIQVNGNPDDRTLALIQQAVAQGGKQVYDTISSHIATGKGDVSKALGAGWATKRRTG